MKQLELDFLPPRVKEALSCLTHGSLYARHLMWEWLPYDNRGDPKLKWKTTDLINHDRVLLNDKRKCINRIDFS